MGFYPFKRGSQKIQTDVPGTNLDRFQVARLHLSAAQAAAASTTGVHAAVTDTGSQQVITTGITNPPYPRNVSATAAGPRATSRPSR